MARLKAKKQRLADREAAQVKLDLEEAKFKNENRKQQIRKSKMQMLQQTDMMKNFRSAMLLTEVAQERADQADLSTSRTAYYKRKENDRVERMVVDIREGEEKELRDLKEARLAAMAVAGTHLEDAARHRESRRTVRLENLRMQSELDKDYIEYVEQEGKKAGAIRAKNVMLTDQRRECDFETRTIKEGISVLDRAAGAKALLAKTCKDEWDEECKRRMLAERRAKIELRERLAESLHVQEQDRSAEEAERIAKVQAERNQQVQCYRQTLGTESLYLLQSDYKS